MKGMNIMYYRYEYIDGCRYPHTGIIAGMREIFADDMDTAFELVYPFEDELPNPDIRFDQNGNFCFFTEFGNKTFIKDLERIIKTANNKGIRCKVYICNDDNIGDIVYKDDYQVIVRNNRLIS